MTYITDGVIIYIRDVRQELDTKTFRNLWNYMYKDEQHVYMYDPSDGLEVIDGVDAKSVEFFEVLYKDNNYV